MAEFQFAGNLGGHDHFGQHFLTRIVCKIVRVAGIALPHLRGHGRGRIDAVSEVIEHAQTINANRPNYIEIKPEASGKIELIAGRTLRKRLVKYAPVRPLSKSFARPRNLRSPGASTTAS